MIKILNSVCCVVSGFEEWRACVCVCMPVLLRRWTCMCFVLFFHYSCLVFDFPLSYFVLFFFSFCFLHLLLLLYSFLCLFCCDCTALFVVCLLGVLFYFVCFVHVGV